MHPTRWSVPASRTRCCSDRPARRTRSTRTSRASSGPTADASRTRHRGPLRCWAPAGLGPPPPPRSSIWERRPSASTTSAPIDRMRLPTSLRPAQRGRPSGRGGVGRRGRRRRRRGRQRNTRRDVLPPGTPVDLAAIRDQQWLFDAIYSPIETELMARAAEHEDWRRSVASTSSSGRRSTRSRSSPDTCSPPFCHRGLENRMQVLERERTF